MMSGKVERLSANTIPYRSHPLCLFGTALNGTAKTRSQNKLLETQLSLTGNQTVLSISRQEVKD